MNKHLSLISVAFIVATFLVVGTSMLALGVTSTDAAGATAVEWAWARHSLPANVGEFLDRILWPVFAGICLLVTAAAGCKVLNTLTGKWKQFICYGCLFVASAHWLAAVQHAAGSSYRELKPLWVVYDSSASGYFASAAFEITDVPHFLQTYEDRMAEGDVLHEGTHPPGLFLLSKACVNVCEEFSAIGTTVLWISSKSSLDAFRTVESSAGIHRPLSSKELAGLLLTGWLMFFMACSAIVPLCLLVGKFYSRDTAWIVGCLWSTIPAIAVFFPKSDVMFPAFSTTLLLCAVMGIQSVPRAILVGIPAGCCLFFSAICSLAILPTVAAIAVFLVLNVMAKPTKAFRSELLLAATVLVTVAILVESFYLATDCNLLNVFLSNLKNHAGFYDQFQRTWWKWLLVNPIEFAFAVGLPVFSLALASASRLISGTSLHQEALPLSTEVEAASQFTRQATALARALVITWLLLWLSGKNSGEAARLWCFLCPWVLFLGASTIEHFQRKVDSPKYNALLLIATQLIIGLITVGRVNGFSF